MKDHKYPKTHYKFGVILTLPATGSEWNSSFVISRRETQEKLAAETDIAFPVFSLIDPRYTMTLPLRQIRNGIFDGFAHFSISSLADDIAESLAEHLYARLDDEDSDNNAHIGFKGYSPDHEDHSRCQY